ncbi:uncharacterized protein LOC110999223 isoform X5 [Pieris rapae]|uniref:uncharacterized protein LOC110999223 isoform X5 n=1 Tax=Pieris rapae TaxID=64459 RepID=UPI001E27F57C|nr:uncharacterized protein LOC110999223 isoform X5 [Pieris rapae]
MRDSILLINSALDVEHYTGLIEYIDIIFTTLIAGPLIIIYWLATWNLLDMYIYPEDPLLSALVTTSMGLIFGLLLCVFQEYCCKELTPEIGKVKFFIVTRLYNYVGGLINVAACRGVWSIMDIYEDDAFSTAVTTVISTTALICLKGLRNLESAPYSVSIDADEGYFDAPTFYRTSSKETALYILDCVFSVTVVGSLVVFVWRGLWALIDIYLYPDDPVKSCWTSLIVGYSMVVVTFSLQAPMRWVVARLQGAPRLLIADVYHLLSFASTVNVWRGVWGLLDIYFLPDSPLLSNWSCHIVSLALLILLNCSNSILVRGVYIDAEEPAGECVIFPCHYLRLFFHKEKTKRHKALDLTKKMEEASVPLQTPEEKV